MHSNDTTITKLTRLLEIARAPDASSSALSETQENIPQLARFLFLRQAWSEVCPDGDTGWIAAAVADAKAGPDEPGAGIGPPLERLLAAGVAPKDISDIVRVMQWRLLFQLCYLIEDPGELEPELSHVAWGLFELDASGQPLRPIRGLHESVLETDPTGREMRPATAA